MKPSARINELRKMHPNGESGAIDALYWINAVVDYLDEIAEQSKPLENEEN